MNNLGQNYILPLCLVFFINIFMRDVSMHVETNMKVETETCRGYKACASVDKNKLNIHLVPYVKDSTGSSEVVDQYLNPTVKKVTESKAHLTLSTVIEELLKYSDRRFIYSHTALLLSWWNKQTEKVRKNVRTLIKEGRLEIVGGGWSINDEAVTHYQSLIDQYTWGFRRLKDACGPCALPKVGWQIDSFGHSREQASLFAQMGFDGLFLGRLHYEKKKQYFADKTAEFIWEGSRILGKETHIFTSVIPNVHCPPPGFCSESLCSEESIVYDANSHRNFIHEGVERFVSTIQTNAKSYKTNHIIVPMAWDSYQQSAEAWFTSIDKLMSYIEARYSSKINIIYSTPSCYLKALNDLKVTWPVKKDDFFPYASRPYGYTTGLYSSRPTHKYAERQGNNHLQVCKQLSVFVASNSSTQHLNHFRETMGLMQHHEVITGTGSAANRQKYLQALHYSTSQGVEITTHALRTLSLRDSKSSSPPNIEFHTYSELNISACSHTENNRNFVVTLYNPWTHSNSPYVRLPVRGNSYKVIDVTGKEVKSQIVPIHESVIAIPGRKSSATKELVFRAINVSPLGYRSYYISENTETTVEEVTVSTSTYISNEYCNISIDTSGNVVAHWYKMNLTIKQSFHYYESSEGNNKVFADLASGASIFRPISSDCNAVKFSGSLKVYKGELVQEIHLAVNEWVSQVIRLYKRHEHIEFDWLTGPLPVRNNIGKEFITRYSSSLQTEGKFYTDSNGREMIEREGYQISAKTAETVSRNYYPVPTKISLRDKNKAQKFSILTDRSQGGSSLSNGQIELMLHRRTLKSDGISSEEALNDMAYGKGIVVRGKHHVIADTSNTAELTTHKEKALALKLSSGPLTFISLTNGMTFEQWKQSFAMKGTGLKKRLPKNVHILTLEPWETNKILLRLEHSCEISESTKTTTTTKVNLKDLLQMHKIKSVRETTLGGNQWKSESKRLTWTSTSTTQTSTTSTATTKSSGSDKSKTTEHDSKTTGHVSGTVKTTEHDSGKTKTTEHHSETSKTIGHGSETTKTTGHNTGTKTTGHDSGKTEMTEHHLETTKTTGHDSGTTKTTGHDSGKTKTTEHHSETTKTTGHGSETTKTAGHNTETKTTGHDSGKAKTTEHHSETTKTTGHGSETTKTTGHNTGTKTTGHDSGKTETTEHHSETTKTTGHGSGTTKTTAHNSEITKTTEHQSGTTKTVEHDSEKTKMTGHNSGTKTPAHNSEITKTTEHQSGTTKTVEHDSEKTKMTGHNSGTKTPAHNSEITKTTEHQSGTTQTVEHDSEKTKTTGHDSGTKTPAHNSGITKTTEHQSGTTKTVEHDSEKIKTTGHDSGTKTPAHNSGITKTTEHQSGTTKTVEHDSEKTKMTGHNSGTKTPAHNSEITKTTEHQSGTTKTVEHDSEKTKMTGPNSGTKMTEHQSGTTKTVEHDSEKTKMTGPNSGTKMTEHQSGTTKTVEHDSETTKMTGHNSGTKTTGHDSGATKAELSVQEKTVIESSEFEKSEKTEQSSKSLSGGSSQNKELEKVLEYSSSTSSKSSETEVELKEETIKKLLKRKKRGTAAVETTESSEFTVTLSCMEIRTYIIETASK